MDVQRIQNIGWVSLAVILHTLATLAESSVIGTSVEIRPKNYPKSALYAKETTDVWIKQPTNNEIVLWTIKSPGNTLVADTVSLEYKARPGYFLRSFNGYLSIENEASGAVDWAHASTFRLLKDEYFPGTYAIESAANAKHVRHAGGRGRTWVVENTDAFINDASFFLVPEGYPIHAMGGAVQPLPLGMAGSALNIFTTFSLEAHGEILEWQYYAQNTNPFWGGIWRPLPDGRYILVGKNEIIPTGTGYQSYKVPFAQTIIVRPGDVTGRHTAGQRNLAHSASNSEFIVFNLQDNSLPTGKILTGAKSCCRMFPLMAFSQPATPIVFNMKHGDGPLLERNTHILTDGELNTCVDIKIGTTLKFDEANSGYSEYSIAVYMRGFNDCVSTHNNTIHVYQETMVTGDFIGSYKTCDFLDSKYVETPSGYVTGCMWSCGCEANVCSKGYVSILAKKTLCELYIKY
ncbi:unnamed protein product [Owenia fusiformis]|uniref:Uncharacterized protein n=1 Tax=Owenia fusiformis TaxID=6347 RepID=A0A8S4QBT1_OWEFU|nr:unnamed protein product [Owenia fusiformis]